MDLRYTKAEEEFRWELHGQAFSARRTTEPWSVGGRGS